MSEKMFLNILEYDKKNVGNGQFAMSHGSYDSNLGSKMLILAGDIRLISWLNIGDLKGPDSASIEIAPFRPKFT